jgi:C4-dicarboxylate transporter DctM subunit
MRSWPGVRRIFLAGGSVSGGVYLFAVTYIISRRRVIRQAQHYGLVTATRCASWALMAVIIWGTVRGRDADGGGVLAVVYSLVVGFGIHRTQVRDLPGIAPWPWGRSSIIVGASGVMGWLVANLRIGEVVVSGVTALTQSPWMILLLLNLFFLVVGCLMDPLAGMLIFIPVLMPLIKHVHITQST